MTSSHVAWTLKRGAPLTPSPLLVGEEIYVVSDNGIATCLDAKTGALGYSLSFHHWPMFSSPAIAGTTLYIGSHAGTLIAIDLEKHATAWTFSTDGANRNAATYTKKNGDPDYGDVYGDFFYDDMVSGVLKMLSVGAVLSSPVVEQDVIYFGSTDGNLYAIS